MPSTLTIPVLIPQNVNIVLKLKCCLELTKTKKRPRLKNEWRDIFNKLLKKESVCLKASDS